MMKIIHPTFHSYSKFILSMVIPILQQSSLCSAWSISSVRPIHHLSSSSLSYSSIKRSTCFRNAHSAFSASTETVSDSTYDVEQNNNVEQQPLPFQREDYPDNIILFDGVCNFCNTWVDLLLRLDSQQKFVFAPLQSDVGKNLLSSIGKNADDISSVLLIKKGDSEYYDKSDCVLQVVKELGPLGGVFSRLSTLGVPTGFRNGLYDIVAENRYNFLGKRDECRCGDPKYFDRFIS